MKNKGKLFDFALYRECLRQIRTIGIVSTVLISIFAGIIPLFVFLNNMSIRDGKFILGDEITLTIFISNVLVMLLVYLLVPIMTLQSFNFLTKRNASDFYHSIPYTRKCFFLTKVLAILTWGLGIIFFSTLVSCVTIAVLPSISMQMDSLGFFLLGQSVSCILITMIFALGCSLAGTTFSGVFIALLIMLLPRILMGILMLMIQGEIIFLGSKTFGFIFDPSYNILLSQVMSIFSTLIAGTYAELISVGTVSYTLVLSLIYGALGMYFFATRGSERSGHATAHKNIQAVVRMITAFLFTIPAICMINSILNNDMDGDVQGTILMLYMCAVCYICAILAYFIYELITTKKWKNCIKIMPGLLVLAAINVGAIGLLQGMTYYYKNTLPTKDEITYVRYLTDRNLSFGLDFFGEGVNGNTYYSKMTSNIRLQDEALNELLARVMASSVDDPYRNKDRKENEEYQSWEEYSFEVVANGRSWYVDLHLLEKETEILTEALQDSKEYVDTYMNLPLPQAGKVEYSCFDYNYYAGDVALSDSEMAQLIKLYQEDINDLGFAKWWIKAQNSWGSAGLDVKIWIDAKAYTLHLSIDEDMTRSYAYMAEGKLRGSLGQLKTLDKAYFDNTNFELYYQNANYWAEWYEIYEEHHVYHDVMEYLLTTDVETLVKELYNCKLVTIDLWMDYSAEDVKGYYEITVPLTKELEEILKGYDIVIKTEEEIHIEYMD